MAKWNHEPTTAQVRDRLEQSIRATGSLYDAMSRGLETGTDQYPCGDEALTIIARLVLERGKPVADMGQADFEAIGGQIAEWFRREVEAIARDEAKTVAQRLEDAALEIMTDRESVDADDFVSRKFETKFQEGAL